jgi:hypothetical protein
MAAVVVTDFIYADKAWNLARKALSGLENIVAELVAHNLATSSITNLPTINLANLGTSLNYYN